MTKELVLFGLNFAVNNGSDTVFINSLVFMVDFPRLIRFLHGLSLWKLDVCHMCMAVLMVRRGQSGLPDRQVTDDSSNSYGRSTCVHICTHEHMKEGTWGNSDRKSLSMLQGN